MANAQQVVVIMTDTQRKDMLGCYGNSDMKTPCLDRLAAQGIRFERAYTCQPVCGPARSALFTGTWPHSNGSWANHLSLADDCITVGQRLSKHGIHTAYIGKWHLDGSDYFGLGQCPDGWDSQYWYDMHNYLDELSPKDRARSRRMETSDDPALTAGFTFGHRCSNRTIDFLSRYGNEDFLLVVSFDEPHDPFLAPKPYSDMYKNYRLPERKNWHDSLEGKPEQQQLWAQRVASLPTVAIDSMIARFLGCNSFIDEEMGRILDTLEQYTPDAMVIYTSDHGDMLYSHGLMFKGATMYDEITNIPFIVSWPGHTPEGTVCSRPLSHIDLTPTIMDVMGLGVPRSLPGKSMRELFLDPASAREETVFMEFGRFENDLDGRGGFQPIRAGYDGRYKLVLNLLTTDEFYDLENDPDELLNLIDSEGHRERCEQLHNRILAWMNDTRDPFRGYQWERRPWRHNARPASFEYTGMCRQRENDESEPRLLDYGTGLEMVNAVHPVGSSQQNDDGLQDF